MLRPSTWIWLGLFGAMAVLVWWLREQHPASVQATPTPSPLPRLLPYPPNEVIKVILSDATGRQVELVRKDQGWTIASTSAVPDQTPTPEAWRVSNAVSTFLGARYLSQVTDDVPPQALGLNPPQVTVQIHNKAGGYRVLHVGQLAPIGGAYYVQWADAAEVYAVKDTDLQPLLQLLQTVKPNP